MLRKLAAEHIADTIYIILHLLHFHYSGNDFRRHALHCNSLSQHQQHHQYILEYTFLFLRNAVIVELPGGYSLWRAIEAEWQTQRQLLDSIEFSSIFFFFIVLNSCHLSFWVFQSCYVLRAPTLIRVLTHSVLCNKNDKHNSVLNGSVCARRWRESLCSVFAVVRNHDKCCVNYKVSTD